MGWIASGLAKLATACSGADVGVDKNIKGCVYIATLTM